MEALRPRPSVRAGETISRGAILLTIAAALFVASGYAVNVWLGRLMGPTEYGRFGVVLALITILNTLQNSSVPQAVARFTARQPNDAPGLLRLGMLLQVAIAGFLSLALAATASSIAGMLGDAELAAALRVSALILPPYGVFALLLGHHNGMRHYSRQAGAQSAYAMGKAVAVILLAYPFRLVGAVLGYVVAAVIGCLAAATRLSGGDSVVGARELIRFAAPLSVYALASVGQHSVDILFVKSLTGVEADAGFYAAAQNVARIPYFLMTGLAVLVLPALGRAVHESREAATGTARQAIRISILAVVPIAGILAGSAPGTLDLLYSATYVAGADVLSVLAIGMAGLSVASIAAAALSGIGHPGWSAMISIVGLVATSAGCLLFVPAIGMVGGAVATTVSAALTLGILFVRLASALPGVVPFRSLIRITTVSAAIGAGLWLLAASGIALVVAYVLAAGTSFALLVATHEIGRQDLDKLGRAVGWHR
jgi:O-antigen/teichoic acid export membrane protein